MESYSLTPENYDGVVSALLGNGELCTTVGPTGFHTSPEEQTDVAHRTQRFYMAGRRRSGPQHRLIDFGSLCCRVAIDGQPARLVDWHQWVDLADGTVSSRPSWESAGVIVGASTLSYLPFGSNDFVCSAEICTGSEQAHTVTFTVNYTFGETDRDVELKEQDGGIHMAWRVDGEIGDIWLASLPASAGVETHTQLCIRGASITHGATLEPGQFMDVRTAIRFSDRAHFEYPLERASIRLPHEAGISPDPGLTGVHSEVITGDVRVDRFREMALYTLRCQATPWSIPPTVSEPYWGAGTFHDEMYPFLGLLSSGHVELAERVPYFRLTTLPQAMQRARGRGALYPWSSTEYGEERDPNGLWLTERFHLGQFAVSIWMLWLYNRDRIRLDDLYLVLREIARYFEMNMLERDSRGRLRTKACVDFDESVGAVTNGPFTICAAISSMEYAANAAEILGRDSERIPRWRALAAELRGSLPTSEGVQAFRDSGVHGAEDLHTRTPEHLSTFGIPDGKPLHYSILGPVFPFRVEVDSERARASAEYIHRVCRSTKGWKPGFSNAFEGSNWMWMAGHLGIVHAMQGNAELAWEAVREGPASAGPFLSPNEHVDKDGVIHVPWFTTGCGGWLYALNCLFVQVDEEGTRLLPAVPAALPNARFRDLLAEHGVRVSGTFEDGRLISLTVCAPRYVEWRYRIPARHIAGRGLVGEVVTEERGWIHAKITLSAAESVSLLVNGN